MIARYYSPKWRRFISPDSTEYLDPKSINGLNLYCFCGNNPINVTSYSAPGKLVDFSGSSMLSIGGTNKVAGAWNWNLILPALPKWTENVTAALDAFSSTAGALETAIWGMSADGRAFSDFYYAAYGINRFTVLDELSSPLGRACKNIGTGLILADLGMNVYSSIQRGYSFAQGATSFGLTAVKDIGIYLGSQAASKAAGTWVVGSKLGGKLGAYAGPVGVGFGIVAGMVVGYLIDIVGDGVIAWVDGLYN